MAEPDFLDCDFLKAVASLGGEWVSRQSLRQSPRQKRRFSTEFLNLEGKRLDGRYLVTSQLGRKLVYSLTPEGWRWLADAMGPDSLREVRLVYEPSVSNDPPVHVEFLIKSPELVQELVARYEPWPIIIDLARYVSYLHASVTREGPLEADVHFKFRFPKIIRPPSAYNVGLRRWRVNRAGDRFCMLPVCMRELYRMLSLEHRTIARTLHAFDKLALRKISDQIFALAFMDLRRYWLNNIYDAQKFRALLGERNHREPDADERKAFYFFFDALDRFRAALPRRGGLGDGEDTYKLTDAYLRLRRECREAGESDARFAVRFRDAVTVLLDEVVKESVPGLAAQNGPRLNASPRENQAMSL